MRNSAPMLPFGIGQLLQAHSGEGMQATNKSAETDARIAVRNAGAELYNERYEVPTR